jgi:hypothetical protein
MARIVLGVGTTHGPILSTPPDQWHLRVEADKHNPELYFQGRPYDFDTVVKLRQGERLAEQITPARMAQRHAACQRAIAALSDKLEEVSADVAVIIGDDQEEVFLWDNMPAFSVFWGDTIENVGPTPEQADALPPGLAVALWGHYPPQPLTHPGEPRLGRHLIEQLVANGFDVAQSREMPAGYHANHGVPHAYAFVYRRLMNDQVIPNVPVFINTFYPPNQPGLGRCYDFGRALGRAIRDWDSDKTVAVFGSGGLSHFVIEEDLDQDVLAALKDKDEQRLRSFPVERFNSGTSEIRNWIALAGALADTPLEMQLVDYVPCYRSLAGTGNAAAFAYWD